MEKTGNSKLQSCVADLTKSGLDAFVETDSPLHQECWADPLELVNLYSEGPSERHIIYAAYASTAFAQAHPFQASLSKPTAPSLGAM